jgi:hypothetical protein
VTRWIVALVDGALVDVAPVDGQVREEPPAIRLLAHGDHDMARPDP